MFGINKKKEKIQSLEAKVRGLTEENQQLQVERNEQRLKADSYKKACEMIFTSHQCCVDCDEGVNLPFKRKEKELEDESELITDVYFENDDYPF